MPRVLRIHYTNLELPRKAYSTQVGSVRTSSKRPRIRDVLTSREFKALLPKLDQRERAIVMLAGSTGLRRGELIALRWGAIDFALLQANVVRSIWRNVEGDCNGGLAQASAP